MLKMNTNCVGYKETRKSACEIFKQGDEQELLKYFRD